MKKILVLSMAILAVAPAFAENIQLQNGDAADGIMIRRMENELDEFLHAAEDSVPGQHPMAEVESASGELSQSGPEQALQDQNGAAGQTGEKGIDGKVSKPMKERYDEGGNLIKSKNCKEVEGEEIIKEYYKNGKLRAVKECRNGQRKLITKYYEAGGIKEIKSFDGDILLSTQLYDQNGKPVFAGVAQDSSPR